MRKIKRSTKEEFDQSKHGKCIWD